MAEGCLDSGERGEAREGGCLGRPQTQTPVQSWVPQPHPGLAPAENTQFLSAQSPHPPQARVAQIRR